MKKEVSEGMMLPKMYGIAWVDLVSGRAICYPVPLNIIAGIVRKFWLWIRLDWGWRSGYDKGFIEGSSDGYRIAKNHAKHLVRSELKMTRIKPTARVNISDEEIKKLASGFITVPEYMNTIFESSNLSPNQEQESV